jgi:two-component system OmpR family sensor kinase
MAAVLAATGLFLYLSVRGDLDQTIAQGLRSRSGDISALVQQADDGLKGPANRRAAGSGPGFAQILERSGRVFDATPGSGRPLLRPAELRASQGGPTSFERVAPAPVPGRARLLATPIHAQGRDLTVVTGTSLADRDKALAELGTRLLIGGPVALLLASLAGYGLATAALRPVEAMRVRAAAISPEELHQRLPLARNRDELHRLGATLNSMLARLEAGQARERSFVADASHELRSPLAMLTTELELIARDRPTGEQLDGAVGSAIAEAGRLGQLTSDLLVLAQADSDGIPIATERLSVAGLVADVGRRYPAVLVDELPELELEADPRRLEQALGNMVENALNHGAGPVRIGARAHAGQVELHVRDSGPGFPPGFLGRAFERFARADGGRGTGGTGLGLAIVAAIAAGHGGSAHAANRSGSGADVWIAIPLRASGNPVSAGASGGLALPDRRRALPR